MQPVRRPPLDRLAILLGVLILAGPALGQSGRLKVPPKPQPAPSQEPPPAPPEQTPPPVADSTFWGEPANGAEAVFAEFERTALPTSTQRSQALDQLRSLGLETRTTALKALGSAHGPSVQLAAELLEWVGLTASEDADDVAALIEAASRTNSVEACGSCLDAAIRLNGGSLPSRTVSLLSHPNRNVRTVVEGRLRDAPSGQHLERLMQAAEHGRDADVRLRGARLLARQSASAEARPVLRNLLRDESIEVAFTAAAALAGEGRAEQTLYLVSELRQGVMGAEAGYLAYALLLQQARSDAALVPEDALQRLEVLLQDGNLFASGAAAACLAEYAHRTTVPVPESWSKAVGFALVRAIGGVVFYPQYARFSPMAIETLQRVSGEEFADRGGWLQWYEGVSARGLNFLRARLDLPAAELARLRVSWARPDASGALAWRVLAGEGGWLRPSERLVGARVLAEAAAALRSSGLLESIGGTSRFGHPEEPLSFVLELVHGEQRKRLSFRGSSGQGAAAGLLEQLDVWHESAAWQLLAGEDGIEFLRLHLDAMEGFDPAARAMAMAELTRGRVARLEPALLRSWCERLRAAPGVASAFDAPLAIEFLAEAPARAADAELAELLVETALLRADASLMPFLAEAAVAVEEPLRSRLLAAGLPRLGLEAARLMLADARLELRVAAASAMRTFGVEAGADLRALLSAAEQPLRLAALRALGEIADPAAYEAIATIAAEKAEPELRKEATWALGRLGDARGVPILLEAARAEQPALRVTALLALAAVPGQEATQALGDLFPGYAGTTLEGSYLRALLERGAASARATLQPYFVHADPVLARRSALLGGMLGDPAAASSLMRWLPGDPRNAELLESLAATLCVDFRALPDPAGTYLAWWRDHANRPAWSWFQEAAAGSGFTLAAGFAQPGVANERESVRTLLAILESGPAHLRASATYFLHGLTGVDAQVVLAGTPRHEVERRSQPWRAWLDG